MSRWTGRGGRGNTSRGRRGGAGRGGGRFSGNDQGAGNLGQAGYLPHYSQHGASPDIPPFDHCYDDTCYRQDDQGQATGVIPKRITNPSSAAGYAQTRRGSSMAAEQTQSLDHHHASSSFGLSADSAIRSSELQTSPPPHQQHAGYGHGTAGVTTDGVQGDVGSPIKAVCAACGLGSSGGHMPMTVSSRYAVNTVHPCAIGGLTGIVLANVQLFMLSSTFVVSLLVVLVDMPHAGWISLTCQAVCNACMLMYTVGQFQGIKLKTVQTLYYDPGVPRPNIAANNRDVCFSSHACCCGRDTPYTCGYRYQMLDCPDTNVPCCV